MDKVTRLQYLEAMGIDVWVPRSQVDANMSLLDEGVELSSDLIDDNWSALQNEVVNCQKCTLFQSRQKVVFGNGDINADWMMIGDEPNEEENLAGLSFMGDAGVLLTEMIKSIGLSRDNVYLTHIVKCHPVNKRKAKQDELLACGSYLQRQIALLKPKVILAVGRVAAQTILGNKETLSELRKQVHQVNGIPLVVIYHPAYLLRSLHDKQKAWQDLQFAMQQIKKQK